MTTCTEKPQSGCPKDDPVVSWGQPTHSCMNPRLPPRAALRDLSLEVSLDGKLTPTLPKLPNTPNLGWDPPTPSKQQETAKYLSALRAKVTERHLAVNDTSQAMCSWKRCCFHLPFLGGFLAFCPTSPLHCLKFTRLAPPGFASLLPNRLPSLGPGICS